MASSAVEYMKGRMKQRNYAARQLMLRQPVLWKRIAFQLVVGLILSVGLLFVGHSLADKGTIGWFRTRTVSAAPVTQLVQQATEQEIPTQPIDVVVLLDDSGSMAMCWPWPRQGLPFSPPCQAPSENPPSDPEELRYSAARLLLQLADDDDRVAVVRFDTIAEGVGALGGLQRVGSNDNRQQLAATLQPPDDYLPRGYTRMDLGLEQAIQLLEANREPGRSQYVLLLTDGEPTAPGNVPNQESLIAAQLDTLNQSDVFVFPVVLCNPNDGCSGDFLREQFPAESVLEAASAQDLLRIFSEILTRMKPDRSLITNRNAAGALEFTTRAEHGVQRVAFVTPKGGLLSAHRDDAPLLTSNSLNDPNIDLNLLTSGGFAPGVWTAETADPSGFVVVQSASFPELLNPPPSLANSPASVRYYPAGKPPLLIARAVGPGSQEPLLLDGETPLEGFGQDNTRGLILSEELDQVRLQLGADEKPLQLARTFHLEALPDLPHAEVFLPRSGDSGLLDDGRARLQVGFGGGATVAGLAATVYVVEDALDGSRPLVYQANMGCAEKLCTDERFEPVDGRSYLIYYVVQGELDGKRFSDWAQAELTLEPAVYLNGLPAQLDLGQMPEEGWPVALGSGTLEEIGTLAATLVLRNADGEEVETVGLDFVEDVPEEGTSEARLRVVGLESLRPGSYSGEIALAAFSPTGLPMDVKIRPAPVLPVTLDVARPLVQVGTQAVDFGEVMFDTSPNFRLDRESLLPVTFVGKPFKLTAQLRDSSCANVSVVAGDAVERDGRTVVPLRLTSTGPVQPTTCTGEVVLAGPNGDYDVTPNVLPISARVAAVEWSIVSGDLHLRDLQDAGGRVQETLLIRFNGKTPFVVQLNDIQGTGSTRNEGGSNPIPLTAQEIDMPAVEVEGPPNEAGLYEVPITLVARQSIPGDRLRGTFYSGQLALGIAGLPNDVKTVNFNFRSPSIYQRYFAPVLVPVYSLPWVLCTGPLTLLLLLVVLARVRSRGFDEMEIEQAAVAATVQFEQENSNRPAPPPLPTTSPTTLRSEAAWGSSEWGSVWSGGEAAYAGGGSTGSGTSNGASTGAPSKPAGDPWNTSW